MIPGPPNCELLIKEKKLIAKFSRPGSFPLRVFIEDENGRTVVCGEYQLKDFELCIELKDMKPGKYVVSFYQSTEPLCKAEFQYLSDA